MDIQVDFRHRAEDLEPLPIMGLSRFVLEHQNKPSNTEVPVTFVSDDVMAELNERYRGRTGPTDVLSFECDGIEDDVSAAGGEGEAAVDASYLLGDVIIAPDVALRQTQEFRTSFEEEISLLLVHGLLHLCGYDHMEEEEAEEMEALESEILEMWATRRAAVNMSNTGALPRIR